MPVLRVGDVLAAWLQKPGTTTLAEAAADLEDDEEMNSMPRPIQHDAKSATARCGNVVKFSPLRSSA